MSFLFFIVVLFTIARWESVAASSLVVAWVDKMLFLDSSMVEHSAVNRRVVGSSPTRGVILLLILHSATQNGAVSQGSVSFADTL